MKVALIGFAIFILVSYFLTPFFLESDNSSKPDIRKKESTQLHVRLNTEDFVERISSPLCPQLEFTNKDDLRYIVLKIQRDHDQNLSSIFHLMHLFGPNHKLDGDSRISPRLQDLILNSTLGKSHFEDGEVLVETRWGLRFPEVNHWFLSNSQRNTEAHPGQGLATLASAGIPLTANVVMQNRDLLKVQDILDDLKANFVLEGDIYWDVIALSIYLPPENHWVDKYGRSLSFNKIADELISRKPSNMLCAGTHGLIALTTLLRVDRVTPILNPSHREKLKSFLAKNVNILVQSELPDGGWSSQWFSTEHTSNDIKPSVENIIQATGHHLEWLILLPSDLQPDPILMEKAARNLTRLLLTRIEDAEWRNQNFCPLIHAIRSIVLLSGLEPGEINLHSSK